MIDFENLKHKRRDCQQHRLFVHQSLRCPWTCRAASPLLALAPLPEHENPMDWNFPQLSTQGCSLYISRKHCRDVDHTIKTLKGRVHHWLPELQYHVAMWTNLGKTTQESSHIKPNIPHVSSSQTPRSHDEKRWNGKKTCKQQEMKQLSLGARLVPGIGHLHPLHAWANLPGVQPPGTAFGGNRRNAIEYDLIWLINVNNRAR